MAKINPRFANKELLKLAKKIGPKNFEPIARQWHKDGSGLIKKRITNTMRKGSSPVKGVKWDKYSDGYVDRMRKKGYNKTNKVDLYLEGDLHKSIDTLQSGNGFALFFTDDKFDWHDNKGAGRGKVIRQIIPKDDQRWIDSIEDLAEKTLLNAIKKVFKKLGIL